VTAGEIIARGKSELHRAGCWVTPRGGDPGKVPQKPNRRFRGKGEKVRQELTAPMVTSVAGKPHPEQGQIEGQEGPARFYVLGLAA